MSAARTRRAVLVGGLCFLGAVTVIWPAVRMIQAALRRRRRPEAPVEFVWATAAGGPHLDVGRRLALDRKGNVLVTGTFMKTASFGANTFVSYGHKDVVVAKIDSDGNFIWTERAGGGGADYGSSIAVDATGNALIAGGFDSAATFGSTVLTATPPPGRTREMDIFVAKANEHAGFVWAVRAGSPGVWDYCSGIAVDSAGNAVVTGLCGDNATFGPITVAPATRSGPSQGWTYMYVAKLDPKGKFLWVATPAGGHGYDVAVDGNDNIVVTGCFRDFRPASAGSGAPPKPSGPPLVVAKLNLSGKKLWTAAGGGQTGNAVAVDAAGNVYIVGSFEGTATFGKTTLRAKGREDIFLAKLDPKGRYLWAVGMGTPHNDRGWGVAADREGNAYVTGRTNWRGVGRIEGYFRSPSAEIFLAKLDQKGHLLWSIKIGESEHNRGSDIVVDGAGHLFLVGFFGERARFGKTTLRAAGWFDIFVTRLRPTSQAAGE